MSSKRAKQDTLKWRGSVKANSDLIKDLFHHTSDLHERAFSHQQKPARLLYIETCINCTSLEKEILLPLLHHESKRIEDVLPSSQLHKFEDVKAAAEAMLNGYCLILLTDENIVYGCQAKAIYDRTVSEPQNEKVVRGPRDGFIENILININLIRKRLLSTDLKVTYLSKGERATTQIAVMYLEGVANPKLIKKVMERLESIHIDYINSGVTIEQMIQDQNYSPFPQIMITERPDVVASNVMDGRIIIFQDGNPLTLVLPCTLFTFYRSPDDYNSRWIPGSFYRLIRFLSFLIGLTLPAIYIAIVAFHYELLPINLLSAIKSSIENVPFPPLIEALIMEITIELIREAGMRLPAPLGPAIGIVGGLVIGSAVVEAGVVSNIMIIVVAITALAAYSVPAPEMNNTLRVLRFPLMFLAAFMGLLGVMIGICLIIIHLCQLESFDAPYLSPFSTLQWEDMKDSFIRGSIFKINKRPNETQPMDKQRERYSRGWKRDGV